MEYIRPEEGRNIAFCLDKISNESLDSLYSLPLSQTLPNFQFYLTVDVLYIEIMQTRTKNTETLLQGNIGYFVQTKNNISGSVSSNPPNLASVAHRLASHPFLFATILLKC